MSDISKDKEESREYFLIRVPKNIDVKELNGAYIDLQTCGPSQSVIQSESDPSQSFGYDIVSPSTTAFSNLTRLETRTTGDIRLDPNYVLKGCVNFYTYKSQPDQQMKPLVPISPNDSIEEIVNRARGHSGKRKSPVKVKTEIASHKKKLKKR